MHLGSLTIRRVAPYHLAGAQQVGISLAERPLPYSSTRKETWIQHKERVACCEGFCAASCVSGCKLAELCVCVWGGVQRSVVAQ